MKSLNYWEKVLTVLAFFSALGSAILNYVTKGEHYFWQLMVIVWISISFIKQRTIDEMEDKK